MRAFRVGDFEPDDDAEIEAKFHLMRFKDVLLDTSAVYLAKDLIPGSGLTVVWGPPKCGKSFWTFDLMMHVARGIPFRGRRVQQGIVVYVALEGGNGFRRRIEAYKRHHGVTDEAFYLITDRTDLVRDHEALIADIKEQTSNPPVAVVIDTLNRSLADSESSDEDMTAYIKAADALRDAFGCAVIIIHHCGVNESRPRGHTSLTGAVEAQLAVKRDASGNVIVKVEYMKDGPEGAEIVSQLELVPLGTDDDGDPIDSCVVVSVKADTATSNAAKVSGQAKVALDALYEALAECGEVPPASSHIPPRTRTTTLVRWRQYCEAKTIAETDEPDSKRKAFVRASKKLQGLKIIGVWNDRVWVAGHADKPGHEHLSCETKPRTDRDTPL
jgi:AAA domain